MNISESKFNCNIICICLHCPDSNYMYTSELYINLNLTIKSDYENVRKLQKGVNMFIKV